MHPANWLVKPAEHLRAAPCDRYAAGSAPQLAAAAESLGIAQLEEEYLQDERQAHGLLPPWPLLAAAARRGLPHLLIGCFAAEGDNVPHAMTVTQSVLGVLRIGGPAAAPDGSVGPQGLRAALTMPCSFAALYGRSGGLDAFLG